LVHSEFWKHERPLTVHAPGCCGHWASAWACVRLPPPHAALVMLHVPGLLVQTGGAQLDTALHGFSGSGGRRLQPAGVYVTEHTGG